MDNDDLLIQAADLNAQAATSPPYDPPGPLEQLWALTPGLIDSLPFMGNDDQAQAGRAYVYASGVWLEQAKTLFPKLSGVTEYRDTVTELAANISRVEGHREFLVRIGYKPSLDGVKGAAADLVKKMKDASNRTMPVLFAGALGVILLLVAFLVWKR
jgi:hypothetical protein